MKIRKLSLAIFAILIFIANSCLSLAAVTDRGTSVIPDPKGAVEDLPGGDITSNFLPAIIKIIMSLTAVTVTAIAIYAGFLFVTHFGEEEVITKAKKMLMWAILGIMFIVLAYAIVWALTNISWS